MLRSALLLVPMVVLAQEPIVLSFPCVDKDLQGAGLICTEEEPCSIYLEFNSIAPAGKKIFLGGDLHTTSATLASVLLSSEDGGTTWKEPYARIPGAALDQIQVYDLEHGWAAGEIQYPLSRDPFFLVTSDGGQSWRRRDITDDGGPGSIGRFWFDSAQHGELIVDAGRSAEGGRYLDYESQTGGESWTLHSATAAQPKLRRAPPSLDNPDFRVRVPPGGKAYQVEKRDGDKWVIVASFPVEVASCKMKAAELKEPVPPTDGDSAKPDEPKDYVEELKLGSPGQTVNPKTPAAKKTTQPNPAKKDPQN